MTYLKLIGGSDKFTTIPEAGCGLHGQEISDKSYHKNHPAGNIIYQPEFIIHEVTDSLRTTNKNIFHDNEACLE
jgi:hypothetical protein